MSPDERAKVFKALADPRRLEIVELLAKGSQCGTLIAEALGISVALLCHHWEVLVDAGILKKERQGQLRVCSLDADRLREALNMGAALGAPQAPSPVRATSLHAPARRASKPATGSQHLHPPAKKKKTPRPRTRTT